jgi:hypothetical protein
VELRRALLLFAIVLGLAAIATSVSRPPDRREPAPEPAPANRGDSPRGGTAAPLEVTFEPSAKPPTERLEAGRPATVVVQVAEPGQVEIEGLGLSGFADPLTPARFDVLTTQERSHRVRFEAAGTGEAQTVGTLDIEPAVAAR